MTITKANSTETSGRLPLYAIIIIAVFGLLVITGVVLYIIYRRSRASAEPSSGLTIYAPKGNANGSDASFPYAQPSGMVRAYSVFFVFL